MEQRWQQSCRGFEALRNGEPALVDVVKDALTKDITGGGGDNIALGERFRDRGFKGGAIDEFRVFNRELTALKPWRQRMNPLPMRWMATIAPIFSRLRMRIS